MDATVNHLILTQDRKLVRFGGMAEAVSLPVSPVYPQCAIVIKLDMKKIHSPSEEKDNQWAGWTG